MTRRRAWMCVALLGAIAACGGDGPTATIAYLVSVTNNTPIIVTAGGAGDSIRVSVTDPKSGRFPDTKVTFSIQSGGGTLASTTATTGPLSTAAVKFTPDTKVGETIVKITVGDVSTNVIIITQPSLATAASFATRSRMLDSGTVVPINVTVTDQFGNAISPANVPYTFRTAGIVTNNNGAYFGAKPGQTWVIAAGKDSQLVVVSRPNSPLLTTDLADKFTVKTDTTLTITATVDMHGATEKTGSLNLRVSWDPTLFSYVSSADPGNGAVINTSSTATGVITLAIASSAGFAAKFDVLRLTLKAASVVGRAGAVSMTVNEMYAASSFADLRPRALAVSYPLVTR